MKNLKTSFFKENFLILENIEKPREVKAENIDTVGQNLALMDLSKKSGEKIKANELGPKLSEVTNEFELTNNEITFKIVDPENTEDGQRRSFVFKEKSIFAKELKTAIEEKNEEKIKYLCYKYLRDLYLNEPKNSTLNKKKYGKSNLLMQEFVTAYEAKTNMLTQAQADSETAGEKSPSPIQQSIDRATAQAAEIEKTKAYDRPSYKTAPKAGQEGYTSSDEKLTQVKLEDAKALEKAKAGDFDKFKYYEPISDYSEDEIVGNYDNLSGSLGITNLLKSKNKEIDKNKAAQIVAEIIHASAASNFFTDENIFDTLKEHKIINYKEDYEDFAKKIPTLDASQPNQMLNDFLFIRELSAKLKTLKFDKKTVESSKNIDDLNEGYSESDKKTIKNLEKLFNFSETDNSTWEKIVALIGGAENADGITMKDLDGKTSYLTKGMFQSHTNAQSAIKILLNDKSVYEIDRNGKKKIIFFKLEDKINKLIEKGYAQTLMSKYPNEEDFKNYVNSNEFKSKMLTNRVYGLANMKDFNDEQKKYLQLGYLVDQSSLASKEEKEAKELSQKDLPEYLRSFEEGLRAQNVPPHIIAQVETTLLMAAGTTAQFVDGKFDRIQGFGAGTSIALADGFSLGLGAGGKTLDSIEGGAGLNLTLYKNENTVVSYQIGLSTGGNLGTAIQAETGNKDIAIGGGIGVGIDFKTGKIMLGGNVELTFKIGGNMERNVEKARKESPYFVAFEKFKETKDTQEKYKILTEIPGINATIESYKQKFNLSEEDLVHMIESMEEQIIAMAIENTSILDSSFPLLHKAGIAFVGPIPIPYLSFYIGTAQVFIPNRKSITHLDNIRKIRQVGQDIDMQKALEEAENTPETLVFSENVKELTYTIDGELAVVKESKTVNFKTVSDRVESYNAALRDVEMSMRMENGKMEIKIHNTEDKDVDMFIDPTLTDLAIIKDGNKFCLEGNIQDLVITRDRYNLPFKDNENSSNVRDVITIRKAGSLKGQRSRDWIAMQEKGQYISKKEGQGYALREIGTERDGAWRQTNILEIQNYLEKPDYTGSLDESGLTGLSASETTAMEFAEKRSKKLKEKTPEEVKEDQNDADLKERAISSVERSDFEQNYSIRKDLYKTLQNKMDTNTEEGKEFFEKSVGENINNIDELIKIITQPGFIDPPLNNNEITEAISIIQDEYFSQILDKGYSKMSKERVNKNIAEKLRVRVKQTFLPVLEEDFAKTLEKMGKTEEEAKQLSKLFAAQVIKDTVENLIFKLENDPTFDFRNQEIDKIIAGSVFYSVTRKKKGEYVSTTTQSKRSPDQTIYIIETGILKVAQKKYPTSSEIGKVLLEMLSPTENLKNTDYLKAPLVLKLMSLDATKEILGKENNRNILLLMENPSLLDGKNPEDKEMKALEKLKELLEELREAEIAGKTLKKTGPNGEKIEIDITGEITAGAFSKCVNSSFLLLENLEIRIYDSEEHLIARDSSTHETSEATHGLIAATLTGGVAIENTDLPTTKGGKKSEESYKKPETRTDKSGEKGQMSGSQSQVTKDSVISTGGTGGTDQFKP